MPNEKIHKAHAMREDRLPRYRHIVRMANSQLSRRRKRMDNPQLIAPAVWPDPCPDMAVIWPDCVMVRCGKVIYATIVNYVQNELRYMDAGDEAQQRQQGQQGLRVY
jgi:hypothetical protein